jgi:hypothetical protein
VVSLSVHKRRELLDRALEGVLDTVRVSQPLSASVNALVAAAKENGLDETITSPIS